MGAVSYLPVDELLAEKSPERAADSKPAAGFGLLEKLQNLWKPMALAFSLAAVGFIAVFNFQPQGEIYAAGTGQYLAVTLGDGSVVELNTNSEISVSLTDSFPRD